MSGRRHSSTPGRLKRLDPGAKQRKQALRALRERELDEEVQELPALNIFVEDRMNIRAKFGPASNEDEE